MCAWFQKYLDRFSGKGVAALPGGPPGRSSRRRRVTIGLDFGTSTTKCCFREEGDRKPFHFVGFACPGEVVSPLFPSVICVDGRLLRFGYPSGSNREQAAISSFKMCLLCQAQHDQGLTASQKCGRCSQQQPGYFEIDEKAVSAEDLCTLHVAVILSEVFPRIPEVLGVEQEQIRVQLNAAAPLDQMSEFGPVGTYFDRIMFYAMKLAEADLPCRVWPLKDALADLEEVRKEPVPPAERSPTRVFPETHAAITAYLLLAGTEKGLYGIADIGAGTTDVSFFWLQKDREEVKTWYYAAGSKRVGMDDVDKALAADMKVPQAELRAARQKMTGSQLTKRVPAIRPVEQAIYGHYDAVYQQATEVHDRPRDWCSGGVAGFKLFLVGGGSLFEPVAGRLLRVPPKGFSWKDTPSLLEVPGSCELCLPNGSKSKLSKAPEAVGSLLLLAYGLANFRGDIPKYDRDREGLPAVQVVEHRFTPEDLFGHT